MSKRTCVQNALNLNRNSANSSGFKTSDIVALAAAVAVAAIVVDAMLGVGLSALSFLLPDILIYQVSPLTL
jgi:hypothetical protein